jgi:molybdopterin/thiamine biosynthesis adenylyltransferase
MTVTLVLPESVACTLRDLARLDVETGAVLLTRPVRAAGGDLRLLARELHQVPECAYERRASDSLLITSDGYVPALARAEECGAVPLWLHTHPGDSASPRPSSLDHGVDMQLGDLFRVRSGSEFYGALIVSLKGGDLRFTGHLDGDYERLEIDRLLTIGARITLGWNDHATKEPLGSLFDRQVRAFGGDVQRMLGDLRVAIVGCGGTGSSVAEQLVRLGVRHMMLIDPDALSESNLTRVYGSERRDVGRRKVDVLGDYLRRVAPTTTIDSVASMITVESTARALAHVDVVFGCTDDNAGRLVLSRLATYLLALVIDCGVIVTSDGGGRLDGIFGRVTVLHPGAACLVCRGRVDLDRARSEMLTPSERVRRVDEGYAPALRDVEPAVVPFTTAVAASAVCELLERITAYGPDPVPSEILLRIHDRAISSTLAMPAQGHYCHPASGKLGLGMTEPFLEQVWQA